MRNEEVVAHARKRKGCREDPPGSNGGKCVHEIQSSTGAYDLPWCASFVFKSWQDADIVSKSEWATASTYQMVADARRKGWLADNPVQGCAVVWNPGSHGHTEIFVAWANRSLGLALTIGGNTSDAVLEHVRNVRGSYFVVPPILLKSEMTTVYWWEDPAAKPVRHGMYVAEASRENAVRAWVSRWGNPGHVRRGQLTVRDPRTGKKVNRYTFWTGQARRSPDFSSKAARDKHQKETEMARGHKVRSKSRKVKV